MKFFIVNTSDLGENSVTYNQMKMITEHPSIPKNYTFDYYMYNSTAKVDPIEFSKKVEECDCVIFLASPAHFMPFAQVHELFEKLHFDGRLNFHKKPATVFSTNMRLFDNMMNNSLQMMIKSLNFNYLPPQTLATNDMLNKKINFLQLSQPDEIPEEVLKCMKMGKEPPVSMAQPPMNRPSITDGLLRGLNWFKGLCITLSLLNGNPIKPLKDLKAVFVYTIKDTNTLTTTTLHNIEDMKSRLKTMGVTSTDLYMKDYNVGACSSCKYCYNKAGERGSCCYKQDDFKKLSDDIYANDIIIYVGSLYCGMLRDGYFKRFIDREVSNGFFSFEGFERRMKSFGYIVDTDDLSSFSLFKELQIADCAAQIHHFLGICTGQFASDTIEMMVNYAYAIYSIDGYKPLMNCYTEKVQRHFANLALSIPMLLPNEKERYTKFGAYEPIKADSMARPIEDLSTMKQGHIGRVTPFRNQWQSFQRAKANMPDTPQQPKN